MSHAVESLLRFGLIKYFLVATVCLINEFFYIYLHTQVLTFRSAKVTTRMFSEHESSKGKQISPINGF